MADIQRTVQNLEKRGYRVSRFAKKEEAARYLLEAVGDREVGFGGSVTLEQLDIYPRLRDRGQGFWHWYKDDAEDAMARANAAPVYLMSANAVSESGQIVNIDGTGNRVMNMCYGHEALFIVVGANKIAPDDRMAMWRARNVASPKNARRLGIDTPCAEGEACCHDCRSAGRICNIFLTLERKPFGIDRVEVVIVDEALGY